MGPLSFHFSIIIILLGAASTRYLGFEGVMHIREDQEANSILSNKTYLQFEVIKNNVKYNFDEQVYFATLGNNKWRKSFSVGGELLEFDVSEFIPNPKQVIATDPSGGPVIKVVVAGIGGREEYFIREGESKTIRNVQYNFTSSYIDKAINIRYDNDKLYLKTNQVLTQMVMATRQLDTLYPSNNYYPLKLRSMYSDGQNGFVFGEFDSKGKVNMISEDPKVKNESINAVVMNVTVNGEDQSSYVFGRKGMAGRPALIHYSDLSIGITYGAKSILLPFAIKLHDFVMEKYPGTNSASSYASEIELIDRRNNSNKEFRIYMNHILDYNGYRFFQSSFDQDEKGTYLSVNHDFIGTWISYIGYILLTIGLLLSLFSKRSRFNHLSRELKKMRLRKGVASIALFLLCFNSSYTQEVILPIAIENAIDADHASRFGKLVVQDYRGRMKPINTLANEVLRKIARKESIYDLSSDQIILGMFANMQGWKDVPMIKIGNHESLRKLIEVAGPLASYVDFYNKNGSYKLRDEVRRSYGLQPIDRGMYEKELMKVDERVNIASMIYSGRILKIIPQKNDMTNTWLSTQEHGSSTSSQDLIVAERFFSSYKEALSKSSRTRDYNYPNKILEELSNYQREIGLEVIPSEIRIQAEIILNRMKVFMRLSVAYSILGICFLVLLFISVFKHEIQLDFIYKLLFGLVVAGFLFHTIGLGLRWYVSGRAPWSNGYESMIYIAWTTTLAGLIFTRKSLGGLAATMILAATVLLVANLSYLDPEITPLVPVLRSYWLTIHVSLEAGSYGFLMLGALLGLLNLVLMLFLNHKNKNRIYQIIKELSYISEMTLIGGLIMVSVGTYLGGVWANESWGRYWGWDAKETWALVTILVYAFILHMRLIPKLQSLYAFNLASLFGWASVIMTYYGVNYYLSGLHSYAAGDPIPIPSWVYWVVCLLIVISVLAYWRKRKFELY